MTGSVTYELSSGDVIGPRTVRAAGCTRQLVQSFSSDVQYRRYSPGLLDDSRPAA